MEKVVWDTNLSIGIKEIDRQHKQLIAMLNQLIELEGVSVDSETISDTLTKMTDYADYHFTSEEQFMQEHAYPEYEIHKKEHVEFMRKTAELSLGTMMYKKTIPVELLTYLKEWLVEHIMASDRQIKTYIEQSRPS
jgi:hemerythrin